MSDCLFCKFVSGEIPVEPVLEDDHLLAFRDINPQAPVHILIIPKKHIPTLNDIGEQDRHLVGSLFLAAREIAAGQGISRAGYRTVFNCNRQAGQEVFHLHLHLLGGRKMSWPPG